MIFIISRIEWPHRSYGEIIKLVVHVGDKEMTLNADVRLTLSG